MLISIYDDMLAVAFEKALIKKMAPIFGIPVFPQCYVCFLIAHAPWISFHLCKVKYSAQSL